MKGGITWCASRAVCCSTFDGVHRGIQRVIVRAMNLLAHRTTALAEVLLERRPPVESIKTRGRVHGTMLQAQMIDFVTPARHAEAETHAIALSACPPQLPNCGSCGIKASPHP